MIKIGVLNGMSMIFCQYYYLYVYKKTLSYLLSIQ